MGVELEAVIFRLERIEDKVDTMNDTVVKIAVTEEKVSNLLEKQVALERRLSHMEESQEKRLSKVEESQWFLRMLERVFWICVASGVGLLNYLFTPK